MADQNGLSLGIDIGTTSVKISLVLLDSKISIFSTTEPTCASEESDIGAKGSEQSVEKILNTITTCLNRVTDKNRACVKCIAVSGQMHGVLLWNSETQVGLTDGGFNISNATRLFTWQDQRASEEFVSLLPEPDSHQPLASGFGCVTLFWLRQNKPETLVQYNSAGSIMDFFVTILCGLDRPVMSHQIAASWGYFDSDKMTWNSDILKDAGFPVPILPNVVAAESPVGELCKDWLGIPRGTPVLAGLGDIQCAYLSAVNKNTQAVLNLSTSCQLSYRILLDGFQPPRTPTPTPVSYFPLWADSYLAVAASLNGGNVLTQFVKMLKQWFSVFGVSIPEDDLWSKLTDLAVQKPPNDEDPMAVLPLLFGERHCPGIRASVAGISQDNISLGAVFRGICEGIANNLHQMMPSSMLIESGVDSIVVSGSVIDKQQYMLECVKKTYTLDIVEGRGTDSALGAALVGCIFLEKK